MTPRRQFSWPALRRRASQDFEAEIRAHVELEVDRLRDEGLSPDAARAQARRRFGSPLAAQERFHEASRSVWLNQIGQDLRYAIRTMRSQRAFTATTVLTLAVALGLTTVVFTIFNAYVLRPFAVRDPYALHELAWRYPDGGGRTFTGRDYEALHDRTDVLDSVVAERRQLLIFEDRTLTAAFVSGNYFEALGPRVLLGRALATFDNRPPAGEPVVVLSHDAWSRLFDRDPAVIGRTLALNGHRFEIVGVMRQAFAGMDEYPREVWLPMARHDEISMPRLFGEDPPRALGLTVRLRSGVTAARAEAALTSLVQRLVDKGDGVRPELRLQATPAPLSLEMLAVLSPVFAAFVLVLVAACANVSNIMLARANARHREIGVRLSLGASRGRVVRQLLCEGFVIAVLGCGAGLVLAAVTLRAGVALLFATLPSSVAALFRVVPLGFDFRVFAFSLALAASATLLFALLPALQSTRLSLTHALRGEADPSFRASTLRSVLVTGQVAVSLVLLVVAVTLGQNGMAIGGTDLGFNIDGIFSVNVRGEESGAITRAATALEAAPRVGSVAVTSRNPLFGELPKMPIRATDGTLVAPSYMFVSPEYFTALEIPIVRGRNFAALEARTESSVAILSAAGARALFADADPLGQTVRVRIEPRDRTLSEVRRLDRLPSGAEQLPGVDFTIVGVAQDVVSGFVYAGRDPAHLYMPTSSTGEHAAALLVRGAARPDLRVEDVRLRLAMAADNRLTFETLPLEDMRALQMYPLRVASWIGAALGAIALAMSVSGLYGVLTYTFGQRTREIGIRMALGASAAGVVRLVVRQSARLAGLGAGAGLIVAFAALKGLSSLVRLKNVSLLDSAAFLASVALVVVAAALAAYVPARRAARTDPSVTLRADA